MEIIKVMKLSKAVKPYVRTRRGKLEQVSGHERKGLSRVKTLGDVVVGVARAAHPEKKEFDFTPREGLTQAEKDFGKIREWQEKKRMKKSVFVMTLDEALEKAVAVKPYTRTKRGKMERVGEYTRAGEKAHEGHGRAIYSLKESPGVEKDTKTGEKAHGRAIYSLKGEKAREKSSKKHFFMKKRATEGTPAGTPSDEEQYKKLKEFESMLNDEGKAKLAKLEEKVGAKKATPEDHTKLLTALKAHPGATPELIAHIKEALKIPGEVEVKSKEEAKKLVEKKKETPGYLKPKAGDIKPSEEEKKETPVTKETSKEETKEAPKTEGATELASALGVTLKNGPEKYKGFFTSKGNLLLDVYHGKLKDDEKMECLIYGVGGYKEKYVEKGTAGDLWKDEEFKKINGEIGRSEGIRRAFIAKAKGYENPKDKRQALHVALGYQAKTEWPDRFAEFNKSRTAGLEISTLDELYKARTMGAKDIKKRKTRKTKFGNKVRLVGSQYILRQD